MRNEGMSKLCILCQKPFSLSKFRKSRLFCSIECRQKAYGTYSSLHKEAGLPSGSVGALNELRVAVDLLSKGYEVFRALSPCSSSDLAVLKNGKLITVEVRTGYISRTGKIFTNRKKFRAEILAIALPNSIKYEPELPSREAARDQQ